MSLHIGSILTWILSVTPSTFDLWVSRELAGYLHRYPPFDLCVQSLVYHNILGGLGFAIAVFIAWLESEKPGTSQQFRIKLWVTMLASMLAAVLAALASSMVHWLPPRRNPVLADLYPTYLDWNPNLNSFPSESTAAYSALASGFYSLNRRIGKACWVAVGMLVGLPRMFVGGHYLSDVLAGAAIGVASYITVRGFFAPQIVPYLAETCASNRTLQLLASVLAFVWIVEVAVEFRDVVWLRRVLEYLWNS